MLFCYTGLRETQGNCCADSDLSRIRSGTGQRKKLLLTCVAAQSERQGRADIVLTTVAFLKSRHRTERASIRLLAISGSDAAPKSKAMKMRAVFA